MAYDLVIRNGTIVDGSGLDAYRADVGIVGNRIAAVGRIRERGAQDIDADGHVVTPGFIDGHTHMDAQIFWDPFGTFSCHHGVTTVVMGHCGFTLAPASEAQRHLVVRNLERAEDISGEAMAAGIEWSWTTFAEYLDVVDALPKGINYAANIGHSALRTFVMGERAFDGAATDDDIDAMTRELRSALRAGAYGFTTSRTRHHQTSDDRPVASRLATLDELQTLVEVMGDEGAGMFQFVQDPPPRGEHEENHRWLRDLAVATGVPFVVGAMGPQVLPRIDDIAAAGGRIFGVTHPRGIGTLSSFRSTSCPSGRPSGPWPRPSRSECSKIPRLASASSGRRTTPSTASASAAKPAPPTSTSCGCSTRPCPPTRPSTSWPRRAASTRSSS
jgi:N-acyl-D-amino-acid deacylase